jgi:hypothetical protein
MMEEHVYHSGLTMVEYAVMSEVHGPWKKTWTSTLVSQIF